MTAVAGAAVAFTGVAVAATAGEPDVEFSMGVDVTDAPTTATSAGFCVVALPPATPGAAGSAVQTIPAPAALLLASHRSRTKSVDYTYSCMPASTSDLSACDDADPLDGQRTNSGGHVLMGGSTDVDAAFKWQVGEELVSCSSG